MFAAGEGVIVHTHTHKHCPALTRRCITKELKRCRHSGCQRLLNYRHITHRRGEQRIAVDRNSLAPTEPILYRGASLVHTVLGRSAADGGGVGT
jgi:hypothetical protein